MEGTLFLSTMSQVASTPLMRRRRSRLVGRRRLRLLLLPTTISLLWRRERRDRPRSAHHDRRRGLDIVRMRRSGALRLVGMQSESHGGYAIGDLGVHCHGGRRMG